MKNSGDKDGAFLHINGYSHVSMHDLNINVYIFICTMYMYMYVLCY